VVSFFEAKKRNTRRFKGSGRGVELGVRFSWAVLFGVASDPGVIERRPPDSFLAFVGFLVFCFGFPTVLVALTLFQSQFVKQKIVLTIDRFFRRLEFSLNGSSIDSSSAEIITSSVLLFVLCEFFFLFHVFLRPTTEFRFVFVVCFHP